RARRGAPQPFAGAREIRAIETEALRAEVVGHASAGNVGEPCFEISRKPRAFTAPRAEAHREAIAGERAAQELAGVRMSLQHLEVRRAHRGPGNRRARLRHREPLHGDRPAILEPGLTHLTRAAAG